MGSWKAGIIDLIEWLREWRQHMLQSVSCVQNKWEEIRPKAQTRVYMLIFSVLTEFVQSFQSEAIEYGLNTQPSKM